jgi:Tfp pilus assembly protein PilX
MNMRRLEHGFALPTILISSVVMLIVLVSAVSAASSVRASLDLQFYEQLAREAAESGIVRAVDCLKNNNYSAQWSNFSSLTANSPCTGASGLCTGACLLKSTTTYKSYFEVNAAVSSGDGYSIQSIGRVVSLRPDGSTYRSYTSVATIRTASSTSVDDVDAIIFGQ